jgi:cell division septum initiation protein DivIVA
MAMQEDIETVVDRLLEYVKSNGRVKLVDAANALALTPDQVEKIALLLEQSRLLSIKYTFTGIFLDSGEPGARPGSKAARPSKSGPAGQKTGANAPEQSSSSVVGFNPAMTQVAPSKSKGVVSDEISRMEREVLTADNLLNFFERDITRRTLLVESIIDELESRKEFSTEELNAASKEMDAAIAQLESFEAEIRKLSARREHLEQRVAGFKRRIGGLRATIEASKEKAKPAGPLGAAVESIRRGVQAMFQILAGRKPADSSKVKSSTVTPVLLSRPMQELPPILAATSANTAPKDRVKPAQTLSQLYSTEASGNNRQVLTQVGSISQTSWQDRKAPVVGAENSEKINRPKASGAMGPAPRSIFRDKSAAATVSNQFSKRLVKRKHSGKPGKILRGKRKR